MNSRERLLTTLKCQVPDRVPVSTYELVGYNSQSWENNDSSYLKLMQVIREKTDCVCMWNPGSNETFLGSAYPVEINIQEYREEDSTVHKKTLHTPKGDLTQTTKVMANVHTVWQTEHWCKNIDDVDKAISIPYEPLKFDVYDYARIKEEVSNNGIIMASVADPLVMAGDLMEFGEYTVWAMTETEHFAKTVATMHKRNIENLRRMLEVNVVDLYRICGPEYATPPYLPPEYFRKFVVPYVSEMVNLIHSKGAKVRVHCHGKIRQVLDMILATGADSIDPCESPPDGDITLAEVKKRLADKMCIFGNIQLKLLEQGSKEDIEKAVKECMDSAKENSGYVIMPTAAPINSPLAKQTEKNYWYYIDFALKYGVY